MILDIVATVFYVSILVFLVILSVFAYRTIVNLKMHTEQLQNFKLYLQEERQDIKNLQEKMNTKIDELRIQVGIMNSASRPTIQIPYTGAKRGPKPKNQLQ